MCKKFISQIFLIHVASCGTQISELKSVKISDEINQNLGNFVKIPAGSFLMGRIESDKTEAWNEFNIDFPQHKVTITKKFEMLETQVTQKVWQEIMGEHISIFIGEDRPVDDITWNEAQAFIEKINLLQKKYNYSLPTEAEWEYAARGGKSGELYAGGIEENTGDYTWYESNSEKETHPVKQKRPNRFGLYDMPGNMAEWVEDWGGPYSATPQKDPQGPHYNIAGFKRIRGCDWQDTIEDCRLSNRAVAPVSEGEGLEGVGFRLVRRLTKPKT